MRIIKANGKKPSNIIVETSVTEFFAGLVITLSDSIKQFVKQTVREMCSQIPKIASCGHDCCC